MSYIYLVPSSSSSIVSPHQRLVVVVLLGEVVIKDTVSNTLEREMATCKTETGGNMFKHLLVFLVLAKFIKM